MKYNVNKLRKLLNLVDSMADYDGIELSKKCSMESLESPYELFYLILNNIKSLNFINAMFKRGEIIDINLFKYQYYISGVNDIMVTRDFINYYVPELVPRKNDEEPSIINVLELEYIGDSSYSLPELVLYIFKAFIYDILELNESVYCSSDMYIPYINIYKSINSDTTYIIMFNDVANRFKYYFTLSL